MRDQSGPPAFKRLARIVVLGDSRGNAVTGAEKQALALASGIQRLSRTKKIPLELVRPLPKKELACLLFRGLALKYLVLSRSRPVGEIESTVQFIRNVEYLKGRKLPNLRMYGNDLVLLVNAGGASAGLAVALKDVFKDSMFLINTLHPRFAEQKFDLIVSPEHDGVRYPKRENWIRTLGAINEAPQYHHRLKNTEFPKDLPSPRVLVAIGGHSSGSYVPWLSYATKLSKFVDSISRIARGGSVLVTTSRRTPRMLVRSIKKKLEGRIGVDKLLFIDGSGDENSQDPATNDYHKFLANSSVAVVTTDSSNMISEAISSPGIERVYVFELFPVRSERLMKFVNSLVEKHYVNLLPGKDQELSVANDKPNSPNELQRCIEICQTRFEERGIRIERSLRPAQYIF
ncbi:hypothetical protein NDN08_007546 [Rhodosorus marinus]|uniref:Mitochondrial fission protein ELM1 n=1 Tax=Rhodosorus marinus TaxID=101924 RepID=A0AAV8UZ38_9RHOD|nr:hypothetical protein NDN08_007546 [Rhodosorus marinus]